MELPTNEPIGNAQVGSLESLDKEVYFIHNKDD